MDAEGDVLVHEAHVAGVGFAEVARQVQLVPHAAVDGLADLLQVVALALAAAPGVHGPAVGFSRLVLGAVRLGLRVRAPHRLQVDPVRVTHVVGMIVRVMRLQKSLYTLENGRGSSSSRYG